MLMATQQKEAVAVTAVFWDIRTCPVPPGFDARRVGPCIKRFLENLGYSGPLTISAIGRLTNVPDEVLRAVSSTGIVLNMVPFGTSNLMSLVFRWLGRNPPPANVMIISDPRRKYFCRNFDMLQHDMGYNIIKPYPYGLPQAGYYTSAKYLWKSFLLAESGALEEDKCIETGACWVCSVCRGHPSGQGLENFTRHLYSEEHALEKLDWLPSKYECDEDEEEEEEEELLLEAVEAGVKLQPERWEKFSYLFATPRECPPLAGVEAPLDSHPENATTMGMEDDPFLRPFQPSDLKTASEFLKNWLPFLYKDLCKDCVHVLSNRIRSLDPASPRMSWEDEVKDDEEEEEQRNLSKRAFDATLIVTPEKPKLSRENVRLMSVERKKDFIFYERVKGKRVNLLDGLELHTGVISVPEQIRIVNEVYELQEKGRRGELKERTFTDPQKWMNGKGRVTLNFGCCYNYTMDKAGNPPGILQREEVDPLPDVFKLIIKRLIKWHILPPTCVPDSCIVNIYEEGACIPPHIDNHDFLRPFCTISFLSECNILFGSKLKVVGPGEFSGSFSIPLPVGSVLVLNGNGADVAEHCVPAVPTKRISITFRKMDESKRPVLFTTERDLQGIEPLSLELADKCIHALIRTKESKAKTGEKKSIFRTMRDEVMEAYQAIGGFLLLDNFLDSDDGRSTGGVGVIEPARRMNV